MSSFYCSKLNIFEGIVFSEKVKIYSDYIKRYTLFTVHIKVSSITKGYGTTMLIYIVVGLSA